MKKSCPNCGSPLQLKALVKVPIECSHCGAHLVMGSKLLEIVAIMVAVVTCWALPIDNLRWYLAAAVYLLVGVATGILFALVADVRLRDNPNRRT